MLQSFKLALKSIWGNAIAMEARRVVRIKDGQINFDGDVKDYAAII